MFISVTACEKGIHVCLRCCLRVDVQTTAVSHIPQTMDHLTKFLVENHIMLTSAVSVWVLLVMGSKLLVSLGLHLINQTVQVCLLVWLFH